MNTFQRWMANATTREKSRLARLARTTVGTLRFIAGGYRNKGKTGPLLARRIERAGVRMGLDFRRETLSRECAGCEFAKRCRS